MSSVQAYLRSALAALTAAAKAMIFDCSLADAARVLSDHWSNTDAVRVLIRILSTRGCSFMRCCRSCSIAALSLVPYYR